MNPRDELAREFLRGLLANSEYNGLPTIQLVAMAYEVADEFIKHIDPSCPVCHAKPDEKGNVLHVSGCPGGWPE